MSNRTERREKLRQRMQNDAATRDQGGGRVLLLDLSDYEDVNWFKAKKGKNEIDILPFEITTENDPGGASIGDDNYKLEIWKHNNVGPKETQVLCLQETFNKACPICEARKEMLDAGADWKDDEVKALGAKRRCIYNVIDLNDTDKHVQLFEQSHFKFEKELFGAAEYKNPDFICFADIEEGYTVTFRGSEETFNKNKFIEPKDFDFEPRDPYGQSIYKDVYPLDAMLIVPTYEEVQSLFMGVDEPEEKEVPKKETSTRKRKTPERTSAKEGRESPKNSQKSEPESKKEEKPTRGNRRGRNTEPEKNEDVVECYVGHIAGFDWDNKPECVDCDEKLYNACGKVYEDLEAMKKKKEEEKTDSKSTRNRTRRR